MTQISLITSLYRSEAYLPKYGEHIMRVLAQLESNDLSAEVLVIANDPNPQERRILMDLPVRIIETDRESLYASWNRGLTMMQSDVFGMWNVDDVREATALIEGYRLIQKGYTLVDAPMRVKKTSKEAYFSREQVYTRPVFIHDTHAFTRKHCINPFALMHRQLVDEVGLFDPHFHIVGDLEWSGRAQTIAKISSLTHMGGTFHLHGKNLSSTGNPRQVIEENIVFLRRQQWDEVHPTPDPIAMRNMWETWGNPSGLVVPVNVADMLWGPEARALWIKWQRDHTRQQQRMIWRRRAQTVTDRLGLASLLLKLRR